MGAKHRQEMKKLLGHNDFGPVLGEDIFQGVASGVKAVAAHTVVGSWTLPRQAQIKGVTIIGTGTFTTAAANRGVNYAVTYNGAVAASGRLPAGVTADAKFVPLPRQDAKIASSGNLLEIAYSVPVDLGAAQFYRFNVNCQYLGQL